MQLSWSAPTQREDGTPLSQEEVDGLVYVVAWKNTGAPDAAYVESASFPGALNPGGQYEATVDLPVAAGDLDVAMRARSPDGLWSGYSVPARYRPPDVAAKRMKHRRTIAARFRIR